MLDGVVLVIYSACIHLGSSMLSWAHISAIQDIYLGVSA